ncbi:hypothetical protein HZS55_14860 [Halosimplex rubrum]|uniref:Type II toxin-antitoxin system RelE/ParE family toxin n=1 Tax=Halosimplex rubrum TaxID=869889 RepID=A0A7D5TMR8_9EURY|nr:hypothetical protein [Halosimplex rubrum]QLH78492.1 hypothetical protein HZS55_14860 [Halosimplex rubrum]
MSTETGRPRYVIYLNEACEQLDDLDNSLERRIRKQSEEFLHVWNASDVFNKSVTDDVDYIKKDRGETRAFGTYIALNGYHILLVLTVFKEDVKNDYWLQNAIYQSRAEDYQEELEDVSQDGPLDTYIENLRNNDDYIVVGPRE